MQKFYKPSLDFLKFLLSKKDPWLALRWRCGEYIRHWYHALAGKSREQSGKSTSLGHFFDYKITRPLPIRGAPARYAWAVGRFCMAVELFAGLEMSIAESSKRVSSTWNITENTSKPLSYARRRPGGLSENIPPCRGRGLLAYCVSMARVLHCSRPCRGNNPIGNRKYTRMHKTPVAVLKEAHENMWQIHPT